MKTLILSEIHGNWPALQAVLAAEPNIDQILCLGDLVNYGPQPAECVTWAMELAPPSRVLQGNHDRAFGLEKPPHVPIDPPLAAAMQAATSHLLTSEMKNFLATLQPSQEFCRGTARCVALHAALTEWRLSFRDKFNPKWPWESDIILRGHPDAQFILAGHPDILLLAGAHKPFKMQWATTLTLNPGSVGYPSDGNPQAAYAVWGDTEVTLHRVSYDIEKTIAALAPLKLDSKLKGYLAETLRTGTNAPSSAERPLYEHENDTTKSNSPDRISERGPNQGQRSKLACAN